MKWHNELVHRNTGIFLIDYECSVFNDSKFDEELWFYYYGYTK